MYSHKFTVTLLMSTLVLAACSKATACEQLREKMGADPSLAGITQESECEAALATASDMDAGSSRQETEPIKNSRSQNSACRTATVTDADGNVYDTVSIGTQCWMQQNMRVGTMIAVATAQTDNGTTEKYCYEDNENNCTAKNPNHPDGGLYLWGEAMGYATEEGAQGICPSGWHVPTDSDFIMLENFVLNQTYQNPKAEPQFLMQAEQLSPNGSSSFEFNYAGFGDYASGYNAYQRPFTFRGSQGGLWSSSSTGIWGPWSRLITTVSSFGGSMTNLTRKSGQGENVHQSAYSVRCIQD